MPLGGTVVFAFQNLGCSFVYPTQVNVSKQCDWTKNTVSTEHTFPN